MGILRITYNNKHIEYSNNTEFGNINIVLSNADIVGFQELMRLASIYDEYIFKINPKLNIEFYNNYIMINKVRTFRIQGKKSFINLITQIIHHLGTQIQTRY